MKKIYQTKYQEKGNCFQACLASILEVELEAIPDFCNLYPVGIWFKKCKKWMEEKVGVEIEVFVCVSETPYFVIGTYAHVEDSKKKHAVIVRNGEVAHDPLGYKRKEYKKIDETYILSYIDIEKFVKFWNKNSIEKKEYF